MKVSAAMNLARYTPNAREKQREAFCNTPLSHILREPGYLSLLVKRVRCRIIKNEHVDVFETISHNTCPTQSIHVPNISYMPTHNL